MSKIQDLKSQLNINLAGFRGPASVPAKLPRQMQENDQYLQPNKGTITIFSIDNNCEIS